MQLERCPLDFNHLVLLHIPEETLHVGIAHLTVELDIAAYLIEVGSIPFGKLVVNNLHLPIPEHHALRTIGPSGVRISRSSIYSAPEPNHPLGSTEATASESMASD